MAGRFPNGVRHPSVVTPTRLSCAYCGDHRVVGGIRPAGLSFVVETPHQSAEMWVYQSAIIRAARNFKGTAWVAYDHQYRREALARKDLNWSVVNSRLYSEAFTSRSKVIPRCRYCLSETHDLRACPSNPDILD